MGLICYKGKIVGGIYDDELLVKNVPSATFYMPNAKFKLPYVGAKKEMLVVQNSDKEGFVAGLFEAMMDDIK